MKIGKFVQLSLIGILSGVPLIGGNLIKNNIGYIGVDGGGAKVSGAKKSNGFYRFKVGYYYYITNPLKISNRIYATIAGITGVKEAVNQVGIHLDGVANLSSILKPYLGVVVEDAIRYEQRDEAPKNFLTYGGEMGILFPVGNHLELEAGGKITNATKSVSWKRSLKEYFIGFNYSF